MNDDELPLQILERIAKREGVTPVDMHPPLYESVDMDALHSLLASGNATLSVSFVYRGYTISVSGTGDVQITEPTSDESSPPVGA
jgi:hypothetical protein